MKRIFVVLLTIISIVFSRHLQAQSTSDYAVQVSANVQESPARIKLHWPVDSFATSYTLYRKLKTDAVWTLILADSTTAKKLHTYTDTNVTVGAAFEYQIIKIANNGNKYYGFGYIYAGIKLPAAGYRGKVILMVDSTFATSLATSIQRLQQDMTGDGWNVITHYVNRTDTVPHIKAIIENDYNSDKQNVKALFLLGHIPVPYSGDLNPDGHANHKGAWPADEYYGDMNGTYRDFLVNDVAGFRPKNWNVPGDGKFDPIVIPGKIVLQIGRVDLYDMPSFSLTETQLLKQYLDKDHNFRVKNVTAPNRAIIDDNFGPFGGEAFAASGYKNYSAFFGDSNVLAGKIFPDTLKLPDAVHNSYLCGYHCGGGWFQGASGVGTTDTFAKDSVRIVFAMSFGSYFGDWDETNSFLRAPLACKGMTLTNCWSGRPHWQLHHMALGETVGYGAMVTMNNNYYNPTYYYNYAGNWVHIALMGDPTLHLHVVAPVSGLSVQAHQADSTFHLSWTASSDTVIGYNVYRANSAGDPFALITPAPISTTTFIDLHPKNGNNVYIVRAVALQQTGSGTYYNESQGVYDSATIHTTGISNLTEKQLAVHVYPNPSKSDFHIIIPSELYGSGIYKVTDMAGKEILSGPYSSSNGLSIHLGAYPAGIYFISLSNGQGEAVAKLVRE